jgi:hypothetical protein
MEEMYKIPKIIVILAVLLNICYANNIHFQNNPRLGQSSLWAMLSNNQGVVNFIMENSPLQLNFDEEVWKDVNGYEGYYQISSHGNVKSIDRYVKHNHDRLRIQKGRTIKQALNQDKYYCFSLSKDGNSKIVLTHRIVAKMFIENLNNYKIVNHKDGNKLNCNYWNLEWCTTQENTEHARINDLVPFGEKHGMSKLTDIQVNEIREKYKPNGVYSSYKLAKEYKVSRTLINLVVSKKIWKRA